MPSAKARVPLTKRAQLRCRPAIQKLFGKSQFSHKSVNLFFMCVRMKDESTDLWGK